MIKTEKLSKSFGSLQAVNEVSLKISDNSIFGLAGTNGAGKKYTLAYAGRSFKTRQRNNIYR